MKKGAEKGQTSEDFNSVNVSVINGPALGRDVEVYVTSDGAVLVSKSPRDHFQGDSLLRKDGDVGVAKCVDVDPVTNLGGVVSDIMVVHVIADHANAIMIWQEVRRHLSCPQLDPASVRADLADALGELRLDVNVSD